MFILCFKDTTKFSNFKIFNDKSFTEITNKKQICFFGKKKKKFNIYQASKFIFCYKIMLY